MKTTFKFIIIIMLPVFAIGLITGCKKNEVNPNSNSIGTMPAHFVQRVMMEEVTAEWCSHCPDGVIEQYKQQYEDSVVAVSIHDLDFLDYSTVYDPVVEAFGQTELGLPCAAINRIQDPAVAGWYWYSYSDWPGRIAALLAQDHQTGIALKSSISGDSATVEVHIGFRAANNYDMRLNVYLVENNVPQHSQSQFTGPPVPGYLHQQVLRYMATPATGDAFSMGTVQEIVKTYKVPVTGYVAANLVFAVSVEKWSTDATDREVFNARQVKVGDVAKWQ